MFPIKSIAALAAINVAVGLLSLDATQSCAQSQAESTLAVASSYQSVSIKPNKSDVHWNTIKAAPDELKVTNETLQRLICTAYKVEDDQILRAPNWLNSQRYDIEAKVRNSAVDESRMDSFSIGDLGSDMLQGLLSDRFKLAVHRETKQIPVYELVIDEDGAKLPESAPAYADSELRVIQVEKGGITGREVPVATLARILSERLGRPVLDKTRLRSHYDVTLQWPTSSESSDSAILSAVREQLGLNLQPQLVPKEFLVIDHVETPSED
jgi:uncharacterized protein (TIGR03435 family)